MFRCLLVGLLLAAPLLADSDKKNAVTVIISRDGSFANFHGGEKLMASYHFGEEVAKPYFYPLLAPGGLKVTRGVPPPEGETSDHPHQKSAWFCHGDIIPEGIELKHKIEGVKGVDFWSENEGHGKIVCVKAEPDEAKGEAVLKTKNEWRTADGVKIMDESRIIRLRPLEGGHLFIFDIDLHASVAPLTFGDTKEGSFGVRVPDSMTETKGKGILTNADGKTKMLNVWGQRSKWCDYSGPVKDSDDKMHTAGVAIFDSSKNDPPACWHSRNYGLMAANPFGRAAFPGTKDIKELVKIDKGGHLKLRYGLFVHTGDVKDGKVAEAFATFEKLK